MDEAKKSPLSQFWTRLTQTRRKVATQLYAAFAVIVALTVAASIVGWFSFDRVAVAQRHVNDKSIPELVAAFGGGRIQQQPGYRLAPHHCRRNLR